MKEFANMKVLLDTNIILDLLLRREHFEAVDIISVTREDCLRAFRSKIEDYEDAVEVESAISADIDCIITRDTKNFKLSPIPTYSPEDFLISIKANLSSAA